MDRIEPPSEYRLKSGQQFGPYVIERPLGRGGMGEIYAARHVTLDRVFALKLIN